MYAVARVTGMKAWKKSAVAFWPPTAPVAGSW
jgi:hypothetical protein